MASIVESQITKDTNGQQDIRETLEKFKKTLAETAGTLAEKNEQRPLVIIIDELDRCRPSYAIELLEIAKHFFSVDHIVFVLAINLSELSHSVQAVYGEEFNARGYLERFFDVDFKLPDADRKRFIQANFRAMKIDQYLRRTKDHNASGSFTTATEIFSAFFAKADISLRKVEQAMRRFGLVVAALPDDQLFLGWTSVVILVVRAIDFELYEKFISGDADDQEIIDSIFDRSSLASLKNKRAGDLFEAVIITACAELLDNTYPSNRLSSLYKTYKERAEAELDGTQPQSEERKQAKRVLGVISSLEQESAWGPGICFSDAIERIELFSADLTHEDAPEN